jgi:hypothetical protein
MGRTGGEHCQQARKEGHSELSRPLDRHRILSRTAVLPTIRGAQRMGNQAPVCYTRRPVRDCDRAGTATGGCSGQRRCPNFVIFPSAKEPGPGRYRGFRELEHLPEEAWT